MPPTKNIAIFCDGTWQDIDQKDPTNVSRLARAVSAFDVHDIPQVVRYDSGVGVESGEDLIANLTREFGGAFGVGLTQKVMDAYEFLCLNYVPGDKIYIFGFSRGAFTARSLSGLLNLIWILKRENADRVKEARKFYEDPRRGPGAAGRAAFEENMKEWSAYWCYPREPNAFIQYIGVWDTVGELGIPKNMLGATGIDAKYQFHDTSLSSTTRHARHAVSIDENRDTYAPTLWTNLAELNAAAVGYPCDQRPYQQRWFPGHHSGVGGGQDDHGLSNSALLWIEAGAQAAGLAFDQQQLNAAHPNPTADFVVDPASFQDAFVNVFGGLSYRMPGPAAVDEISEAAIARCKARSDYHPKTLAAVRPAIDALNKQNPA